MAGQGEGLRIGGQQEIAFLAVSAFGWGGDDVATAAAFDDDLAACAKFAGRPAAQGEAAGGGDVEGDARDFGLGFGWLGDGLCGYCAGFSCGLVAVAT